MLINQLITNLRQQQDLPDADLKILIEQEEATAPLAAVADAVRRQIYGTDVYIRGLIEISNYCKNNCYYCGIRRDHKALVRYRLTKEDILACCHDGYALGFRTFVLQGGEDPYFTDAVLCDIVSAIREQYADCAITLSVGERTRQSYQALYHAGATRYLLRHETANEVHYRKLHPAEMSLANRKRCLFDLKEIGYQVGSGFMVGSPYQSIDCLLADLRFLQQLDPDMIGIGPYLPHEATPFAGQAKGELSLTLRLVSILRLLFPHALLPATTALGTLHSAGRTLGLKAGANVVMPNLSPVQVRQLYALYENKLAVGAESAQGLQQLKQQVADAGYRVVTAVGNVKRLPY